MSGWMACVALAYGLTWLLWVPTAIAGREVMATAWLIPFLLGGFGPSAAAVILTLRQGTFSNLARRLLDWRRISWDWYLIILGGLPAMMAVLLGISELLGLPLPGLEGLKQIRANPIVLIGMVILGLFTGPLAEELGWRGFVLDRLLKIKSPLAASLMLAPIWWAWHLPLFFIEGSNQEAWGLLSLESIFFLLNIFPLTFVMTIIYMRTRRSILAVVLFHFSYNFTLSLIYPATIAFHILNLIGLSAMAGLLWGFVDLDPRETLASRSKKAAV